MTHHPRPALLRAALDAAARGWPVHPLRPGGKAPALHGAARCPRTGECADGHRTFEQRATTDPARIHTAWTTRPYNVGIATGPAALVVIDLDQPKDGKGSADAPGGAANFAALCERAGQPVPTTRTIRTPSGGTHLYFAAPPGIRLGCTASTLAPLIDTRAWGGNLVAPGSLTPSGPYTVQDDRPVADLPGWLHNALTTRRKPVAGPFRPAPVRAATRYADTALARESAAVAATREGGRAVRLLRGVRAVGRFVAWGDLTRAAVEDAFTRAGESAGLPPGECRSIIRSALDYSVRTAWPRETA
jgi:hypothetical protein